MCYISGLFEALTSRHKYGLLLQCFPKSQCWWGVGGLGEGVIWNSPPFVWASRHIPSYLLFLRTRYFYFSANRTRNPFTVSDSEIPVLENDPTHVFMTKWRQLCSKKERVRFNITTPSCVHKTKNIFAASIDVALKCPKTSCAGIFSLYYPQHNKENSVEFGSELYSACVLVYLGLMGDKKPLFNS